MKPVKFVEGSEDMIEGLAIPFGGPVSGKDLDGETFTPETDLALDWYPQGRPLLYDHGTDTKMGTQVIGRQTSHKVTDEGIWIDAQLNRAHRYWSVVKELVGKQKLYFSSGSVKHLVQIASNGAIKRWPWTEQSLTPTPANPYAVVGVKRAEAAVKSLGLAVPEGLIAPTKEVTIAPSGGGGVIEGAVADALRGDNIRWVIQDLVRGVLESNSDIRGQIRSMVEQALNPQRESTATAEGETELKSALAEAMIILAQGD